VIASRVTDGQARMKNKRNKHTHTHIHTAGRRNETRINIAITDSWDFPGAVNRRAYIFVKPALSSGLIKVLYQATSLLGLLDQRPAKETARCI
jgi:hypothetical protein